VPARAGRQRELLAAALGVLALTGLGAWALLPASEPGPTAEIKAARMVSQNLQESLPQPAERAGKSVTPVTEPRPARERESAAGPAPGQVVLELPEAEASMPAEFAMVLPGPATSIEPDAAIQADAPAPELEVDVTDAVTAPETLDTSADSQEETSATPTEQPAVAAPTSPETESEGQDQTSDAAPPALVSGALSSVDQGEAAGRVLVAQSAAPRAALTPTPTQTPEPTPTPAPPTPTPTVDPGQFFWPANGTITQRFGDCLDSRNCPHAGLDIGLAAYVASYGHQAILASRAGTVTTARYQNYGYGNYVVVDHGDGFTTLYAHLSELWVSWGQWVERGTALGASGSTGFSTGEHLHFEVRWLGSLVNPLNYLP
jgi:murein DD-endopeptidase MepM/ murein hydrolase activator NlpD